MKERQRANRWQMVRNQGQRTVIPPSRWTRHQSLFFSRVHFHTLNSSFQFSFLFLFFFFFFCFLGPHLQHMEVPRLEVESELQLLVYTRATAMHDLSRICGLHHSSQQCQIPSPLSETRDLTHNLMDTSQIHFHCTMTGTPSSFIFFSPQADTDPRLLFTQTG